MEIIGTDSASRESASIGEFRRLQRIFGISDPGLRRCACRSVVIPGGEVTGSFVDDHRRFSETRRSGYECISRPKVEVQGTGDDTRSIDNHRRQERELSDRRALRDDDEVGQEKDLSRGQLTLQVR